MDQKEALKIIEEFHNSIKDLRPDALVQSSKELPYTYTRIKYAHFIYLEKLIEDGGMTEEKLQEMMESYGIINSFFLEDPEPTNRKYREYLKGLKGGIITDFHMLNPFGEIEAVNEIYNFIGECWFLKYRTNLFTNNPLGAFIYDEFLKKATREKNVKLLVNIVNTAKTRKVIFPGKRDNEESIFIKA